MKRTQLTRVLLANYQQFRDLDLSLTGRDGEPLERVCFLGRNGTGKSTLLRLLSAALQGRPTGAFGFDDAGGGGCLASVERMVGGRTATFRLKTPHTWDHIRAVLPVAMRRGSVFTVGGRHGGLPPEQLEDRDPPRIDVIADVVADESTRLPQDPPTVQLSSAVPQMKAFSVHHTISPAYANDFWVALMARTGTRAEQAEAFRKLPENRRRTVEDVEADFGRVHPEILPALAELWNRLLAPAGLELDLENVRLPTQLGETIQAHVRVRATKQALKYNALSSGMRAFLFRVGHLLSLYFDRDVQSGFLFIDEPELSLHPDFLADIMRVYGDIAKNTQIFVATHSPIVAQQFRPEERILLEFDDEGFVRATHGRAPEGDSADHLLDQDFHVRSVLGEAGERAWKEFVSLGEALAREPDAQKKVQLAERYASIGQLYRFDPRVDPRGHR